MGGNKYVFFDVIAAARIIKYHMMFSVVFVSQIIVARVEEYVCITCLIQHDPAQDLETDFRVIRIQIMIFSSYSDQISGFFYQIIIAYPQIPIQPVYPVRCVVGIPDALLGP